MVNDGEKVEVGRIPLMIRVPAQFHDEVQHKAGRFAGMGVSMQKFGKFAYTIANFIGEDMDWKANKAYSEGNHIMVLFYTLRSSLEKKDFLKEPLVFDLPDNEKTISLTVEDVLDAMILQADKKIVVPKL